MIISKHKVEQISRNVVEAILALESRIPDVSMAVRRLQLIQLTLVESAKSDCPKCGSHDILVGNNEEPNHCSSCGHEWSNKHRHMHHEHIFKSSETLAVLDKKPRVSFESKIDNILSRI